MAVLSEQIWLGNRANFIYNQSKLKVVKKEINIVFSKSADFSYKSIFFSV